MKDQKITLLQALLLFLGAGYSPAMRCIPATISNTAHQAAWLVIPCSVIAFLPFLYILYKTGKKFEGKSYHDILCSILGKIPGKIVSVFYLVWLLVALGVCTKFAAGNLTSTIFVGTDDNLLMFLVVVLVGIMLRWGIEIIARMNKIIFTLIVLQFFVIVFFLFLHFRADYVTPISTLDVGPVLLSIIFPLGVFAYITPIFIFNDQIVYAKKNKGKLAFTVGYITVKNTLMMLTLIGMLSAQVVCNLKLPFYTAVENIALFNSSAGIDSLFMSIWMLAEFITITFFAYCASRLTKSIFALKSNTPVLTAILGFDLFFAAYLSSNYFELDIFMTSVSPYINVLFGLGIPVLLFVVGKIRKMI